MRKNRSDYLYPIFKHNILKERFGDTLTDTLRSQLLVMNGYKTSIIEFISPEHTSKNIMVKARKTHIPEKVIEKNKGEYLKLKDLFQIKPHLENLIKI